MTKKKPPQTPTEPHELILDHLRVIRSDLGDVKKDIRELRAGVNALRQDVNSMRGDLLRQERAIAAVEVDIDRINNRLGLVDEPPPTLQG